MCGILAVIEGPTPNTLDVLKRRGPDEHGSYLDEHVYLGHTRLSIVHPEAGAQPIIYKDWVVTMNGEIYNYRAKNNETDCFIVPQLLEKYGPDGVHHLDGIFAFVAWNKTTKQVIVARDPIGVVPLYYSDNNVFSTLLAAMPTNSNVHIVPPGTMAVFGVGQSPEFISFTTSYSDWSIPSDTIPTGLPDTISKAVAKRLSGDVPWGVLLSGGLDSTIVATLAVQLARIHRPDYPVVHSFCIGLKDSPDIVVAKQVAKQLGTTHVSVEYTVEEGLHVLRDVIRAIETYDVTTVRASTPMWLLGKVLKTRGIKMVLSGEGSDELFAGYLYNLYCPNEAAMVRECKHKLQELHAYDCQRANKTLGDWGVETRVPFLDKDVVDFAMNKLPPVHKMSGTHPDGPKSEKWFLREAFRGIVPDCVVDRTKAQFSDAVGCSWIDSLLLHAERQISDFVFANASKLYPYNTPATKEAYLYRTIFTTLFAQPGAETTVLYQPSSIACSTSTASEWHENFKTQLDPSGESIQRAFQKF
jgi:asparagine synthase (glutamine-hydrolysing)|tara:strand:- start:849 stop:2429 length:1581 start_codon:yes stop_codon:yes gene_type:complete